jgi:hypothetical protein
MYSIEVKVRYIPLSKCCSSSVVSLYAVPSRSLFHFAKAYFAKKNVQALASETYRD